MGRLETNDWIVLNDIIYLIYSTKDMEEMQRLFLERIRKEIVYDAADFFLADFEDPNKLSHGVTVGMRSDSALKYDELDYNRDIRCSGRSMVYRSSDTIPDERRINTPYYDKVYRANDLHYSLQMMIGFEGRFLGLITLYRKKSRGDFDYYDIFTLDVLKDHISLSISKRFSAEKTSEVFDVDGFVLKYDLTKREAEVLRHIIRRQDNVSISKELVISMNTLKKHERNIYKKCGVKSRMQLFKLLSHGI